MTDYRDLSELPDDDAYWQSLEASVMERVGTGAGAKDAWVQPLVRRAPVLGWLAAAGLAALLFLPRMRDVHADPLPFLEFPDDPLAAAFLAPSPPALATLLIPRTGETE